MRILFTDIDRPKVAAKLLSRLSPDLTLAKTQEVLARVMGYGNWHELAGVTHATNSRSLEFDVLRETQLVLAISDALGLEDGDVQYAVSKARLMGGVPWRMEDHLKLRTTILRERVFGAPARGKPGTVIKVKVAGTTRHAYLRRAGRPTDVVYDTGPGGCGDFEAITPRTPLEDFLPSRLWLPYGYWTIRDGSQIVFSRDYLPLWRIADDVKERLDPWLWIMGISAEYHFSSEFDGVTWARGPARNLALDYLERNRIFELPRLANVMPFMIQADIESVESAAARLYERSSPGVKKPDYARLNNNLLYFLKAS